MIRVDELLTEDFEAIAPGAILQRAAEILNTTEQGLIPVTENDCLLGVITSGDIVRACAAGLDPIRATVREAMTADAICCYPDQSIREAADQMRKGHVHRILVVDRHGRPRGILKLADIAVAAEDVATARRALQEIGATSEPPPVG